MNKSLSVLLASLLLLSPVQGGPILCWLFKCKDCSLSDQDRKVCTKYLKCCSRINVTEQPTSNSPTEQPTSISPTEQPTSSSPTEQPTSSSPTQQPTMMPTAPTEQPTSSSPTQQPTMMPTAPTDSPTTREEFCCGDDQTLFTNDGGQEKCCKKQCWVAESETCPRNTDVPPCKINPDVDLVCVVA